MFKVRFLVLFGIAGASSVCAAHTDRHTASESYSARARSRLSQANPTAAAATTPLVSRVEAYWKTRQAKDLTGAYAFYCTGYKNRVPLSEFLKLTRLTRFDIRDVRVVRTTEADKGMQVTLSYHFMLPSVSLEPVAGETTESWIRDVDQQWCKEDEPLILPFPKLEPRFSPRP